jgi:hypothetical protein
VRRSCWRRGFGLDEVGVDFGAEGGAERDCQRCDGVQELDVGEEVDCGGCRDEHDDCGEDDAPVEYALAAFQCLVGFLKFGILLSDDLADVLKAVSLHSVCAR